MDAIVEVATAKVAVKAEDVKVIATVIIFAEAKVFTPKVATSTLRVPSIAGTSISAVSPDYILIGGTA